jgi:hypothetical protein
MPTAIERHRNAHTTGERETDLRTKLEEIAGRLNGLQQKIRALKAAPPQRVVLRELHAKSGRIDAEHVANSPSVPLKRPAEGLGLNYKAVHRDPSAAAFQDTLKPVKRSLEYLDDAFRKPETVRAWLNTPHPMLDGETALEVILQGNAHAVERLLGNAWNGVVS